MDCPECKTNLVMGERLNTQIDYCPKCRGIWLEKGKLEKLLQSSGDSKENSNSNRNQKDNQNNDDDGGGFFGRLLGGGGD